MVGALVLARSMQQEGVDVMLGLFIQLNAGFADGQLGNEIRCFEGKGR
jgi:hypothetical protein